MGHEEKETYLYLVLRAWPKAMEEMALSWLWCIHDRARLQADRHRVEGQPQMPTIYMSKEQVKEG